MCHLSVSVNIQHNKNCMRLSVCGHVAVQHCGSHCNTSVLDTAPLSEWLPATALPVSSTTVPRTSATALMVSLSHGAPSSSIQRSSFQCWKFNSLHSSTDPLNSPTSSLFSDFGALSISQRRKVSTQASCPRQRNDFKGLLKLSSALLYKQD